MGVFCSLEIGVMLYFYWDIRFYSFRKVCVWVEFEKGDEGEVNFRD